MRRVSCAFLVLWSPCPLRRSGGTATVDPVALAASTDEPEAAAAKGQDEEGRITIVDMPGTSGKHSRITARLQDVAPSFGLQTAARQLEVPAC